LNISDAFKLTTSGKASKDVKPKPSINISKNSVAFKLTTSGKASKDVKPKPSINISKNSVAFKLTTSGKASKDVKTKPSINISKNSDALKSTTAGNSSNFVRTAFFTSRVPSTAYRMYKRRNPSTTRNRRMVRTTFLNLWKDTRVNVNRWVSGRKATRSEKRMEHARVNAMGSAQRQAY
jgi:hypothetical protein